MQYVSDVRSVIIVNCFGYMAVPEVAYVLMNRKLLHEGHPWRLLPLLQLEISEQRRLRWTPQQDDPPEHQRLPGTRTKAIPLSDTFWSSGAPWSCSSSLSMAGFLLVRQLATFIGYVFVHFFTFVYLFGFIFPTMLKWEPGSQQMTCFIFFPRLLSSL